MFSPGMTTFFANFSPKTISSSCFDLFLLGIICAYRTIMEKGREKSKKKTQGFSFIEILISFVITFLLILGTAQMTMLSLLSKQSSDIRLKTSELLSSKLELFKSHSFNGPALEEGNHEEHIKDLTSGLTYIWKWHNQTVSPNLSSVEIGCYPENSPQREIRLLLYFSRDLGF